MALHDILGSRALIERFATAAETALAQGQFEQAVAWVAIAAEHAWGLHPGYFANVRLEEILLHIAPRVQNRVAPRPEQGQGSRRVLHVLTTAYAAGGHARCVERWIRHATNVQECHSVLLTAQGSQPIPEYLREAVEISGGTLELLPPGPYLERAAVLRARWRSVDLAVINPHPHDTVPLLAFGVAEGPPVVILNNTDHTFWLGASVCEASLDFRPSGQDCATRRRGIRQSIHFPLALAPTPPTRSRAETRTELNIPGDARVLLTLASAYKFAPSGAWDFCALMGKILSARSDTHLVAGGPRDDWGWSALRERFPTRVHALGPVKDVGNLHIASDVYLDSLPFASITATLEAALNGLPVVRRAEPRVPLMCNDDPAFRALPTPSTPDEYVQEVEKALDAVSSGQPSGGEALRAVQETHGSQIYEKVTQDLKEKVSRHHVELVRPGWEIEDADILWSNFQQQVSFIKSFGLGLNGFKENRHLLGRSALAPLIPRLLLGYPHYLKQPRLAARIAIELLKQ